METRSLSVALVAARGPDADCYRHRLAQHGLEPSHYPTLADFRDGCLGRAFSGVAVDLAAIAGVSEEERTFLKDLVDSFVVLRLRRVAAPEEIAGTLEGKALAGEELLTRFVHAIRERRPRGVRLDERRDLILSVKLYHSEGEVGEGRKASVANISKAGFYVVTPEPAPQERCFLVISELGDPTPVPCEVRWATPWGASTEVLPGFGVRCLSLTPRQREAIGKLLLLARAAPR